MLPLLYSTLSCLVLSLAGVDAFAVDIHSTTHPISNVFSSSISNSDNIADSSQRCTSIDNCRTLDDIIQSCAVTILACVWFAVHRNIPAPRRMQSCHPNFIIRCAKWVWRRVLDQKEAVMVFVVALFAPEWILAWALRQAIRAWRLAGLLEKARLQAIDARQGQKVTAPGSEGDATELAESVERHSSFDRSTPIRTDSEGIQLVNRRTNKFGANATCKSCEGDGNQCHLVAGARRVAKGDECAPIFTFIDCIARAHV